MAVLDAETLIIAAILIIIATLTKTKNEAFSSIPHE